MLILFFPLSAYPNACIIDELSKITFCGFDTLKIFCPFVLLLVLLIYELLSFCQNICSLALNF